MLDIVLVSSDYLPNIGGVATHVHELARACAALGHRVHVVSMAPGRWRQRGTWRATRQAHDGIPSTRLSTLGLPGGHLVFWRLRRQLREYLRRLTGEGPVVFHVHDADFGTYLAQHFTAGVRVFTNHTSGFLQSLDDDSLRAHWRRQLQAYDRVIAPSAELAGRTIELGYPSERIAHIPNGVDPDRFRPDPEARRRVRARLAIPDDHVVVLAARRFVPKNGMIDFAHALRLIEPHAARVTVVMAGNGYIQSDPLGYEKECLAATRATALGRRARMLGVVDNSRMQELYAAADLSVLPSLKEATSIAGLEAMSTGLPLVGTNVGGIPELIQPDVTGLLVHPGDPRELADAVVRLASDEGLRARMGASARQRVLNEFAWRHVAARTTDVYRSVLPLRDAPFVPQRRWSHGY